MIRFECTRMAQLLEARAAGLSQANALRLEDHLAHCVDCSHQAHLLDGLRELSDASAAPLPQAARQRAVLQAFAKVERPAQPEVAQRAWLVPTVCGALAAAALVAVGIAREPLLGSPSDAHVLSGALERTTRGDETDIASGTGGVMALAHAKVEFGGATRARWNGRARVLRLEQGSVVADVDAAQHRSFQVDTERFRVLVLGTRFEVKKAQVRVTRGRVRVEAPNGAELAVLGAGESYECASAPCQPRQAPAQLAAAARAVAGETRESQATAPSDSLTPDAASVRRAAETGRAVELNKGEGTRNGDVATRNGRDAARSGGEIARNGGEATRNAGETARNGREGSPNVREGSPTAREGASGAREIAPGPAVALLLERARQALGRREVAGAREILANVLHQRLSRRDQAEALTLRAECSLVAGEAAGASAGYALVAKRFADLPAGENALFASARLDAERLSGARAEVGLTRYLARYPHGKFVKEATARLNELRAGQPQP